MLTIFDGVEGWVSEDGYAVLGSHPDTVLLEGDVATYDEHAPSSIAGHDYGHKKGFIINAWAGETIQEVFSYMKGEFQSKDVTVCFWRKQKKVWYPREYEPSEWAKPLPLP